MCGRVANSSIIVCAMIFCPLLSLVKWGLATREETVWSSDARYKQLTDVWHLWKLWQINVEIFSLSQLYYRQATL